MFDIGELFERAQSLFTGGAGGDGLIEGGLGDLITNAGLDPSLLDNLQLDQLDGALHNLGLDPADLSEGQIGELIQSISANGGLEGLDLSGIVERITR